MKKNNDGIINGLNTAFIDYRMDSNLALRPRFISNNHAKGVKVLSELESELSKCDEFAISVAFITRGGITPLLQVLKNLEKKGVKGRILTTDYESFTDPYTLDKLDSLSNIELRMYMVKSNQDEEMFNGAEDPSDTNPESFVQSSNDGFHTKGYIFRQEETYRIIIGSSNLTGKALTVNAEWNTKIISTNKGEMVIDILGEFEGLWNSSQTKKYKDIAETYKERFNYLRELKKKEREIIKKQKEIAREDKVINLEAFKLKPNSMQLEFINNLQKLVKSGETRALLLSSTGTGKTYASAFALREILLDKKGEWKNISTSSKGNGRALFLVHREQIAKQALRSYRKIFGRTKSLGLISGNVSEKDKIENLKADIVFATIQTMSKPEYFKQYDALDFSVIVLDEAHHTAGDSYQRIMEYFNPNLWIGMTASPDRMDGFDVYELFDHNIACEIRLQQAMENNLLCPFHYFGITDIEIDGYTSNDDENNKDDIKKLRSFNYMTSDDRVDYVMKQAKYYGYSGDRVKGLIFVSRREVAAELTRKFNARGLKTAVLTGEDSQSYREECINKLTAETTNGDYLDYILTVDIFNEGVDIPEINQVIMLRPTESPIVFVQQLGRGLRKYDDKDFVVILDFIGNYKNNFMIPIALSGDRTYNKDNIRRYVTEGEKVIPGMSTIHFDEIARKRIYEAIDTANFSDIKLLKDNYQRLKFKLGHIPSLLDFDRYGEMDVCRIFDNASLGSYYKFLVKYEKDYKCRLSKDEEKIIEFVSKKLANGKRIHEIELLDKILTYQDKLISGFRNSLKEKYGKNCSEKQLKSVINVMTNEFPSGSGKKTYKNCVFIEKDSSGDYEISKSFGEMLENKEFYMILKELLEFGKYRYLRDYAKTYQDTELVLYQKYTYEDACRLLNWEHNEVPLNIGGYKYDKVTKTFPVFINYDKAEDIQDTIKYEDHFTSSSSLIAISKQSRTVDSEDVQNFLHANERGISVELFVRKNKDDKISKEFYYLGRMKATGNVHQFIMANTDKTAVEIEWKLDTPVREDIYEYIVNG